MVECKKRYRFVSLSKFYTPANHNDFQTSAVRLSTFKSAVAQLGNLFRPWPTPPQHTPSNGGHKAKAPRQPYWLVTSRDPVTILNSLKHLH